MDSRENPTPAQPQSGESYTLDELLTRMEPQYREHKNTMHRCIAGLTCYAAQLASQGQEEQLPQLRRLCVEMAEFWGLTEDDTLKGFKEMSDQCRSEFDNTVSAGRNIDHRLSLGEQAKLDILDGLKLYAQEMKYCGDMEQWIAECDALAGQLRTEWGMDHATTDKPDCTLIGEDGNIFNLSTIAANTLRENGLEEQADELLKRVFDGEYGSYDGALRVINEYVNIIGPEEFTMLMGGM